MDADCTIVQELRLLEKKGDLFASNPKNSDLYKNIVELSPDSIVTLDLKGFITSCNSAGLKMMKFSDKEEVIGKHFSQLNVFPAGKLPKYLHLFSKIIKNEVIELSEIEFLRKDGTKIIGEVRVGVLRENGKISGIQAIMRDISEIKEIHKEVDNTELKYQTIVSNMNDALYILDFNGKILEVNDKTCEMLGYEKQELINHTLEKIYDGNKEFIKVKIQDLMKKGSIVFDAEHITKSGEKITVNISSKIVSREGNGRIQSIVRNITTRKNDEIELKKLASVIERSNDLINIATLDGKMVYLNKAGCEILGINSFDIDHFNILDVIPENFKELVTNYVLPTLLNGNHWKGELQYRNVKTNEKRDFYANCFVIQDTSSNNPLYLANVSHDITEKKFAEKKLHESREQYRLLANNSVDIIYKFNLKENKYTYVSPSIETILGYTQEEAILLNPEDTLTKESYDYQQNILQKNIESGNLTSETLQLEAIHKEGYPVNLEINANFIYNQNNQPVEIIGVARDVTDRKRTENLLKETEKRYRTFFETAAEGILIADIETKKFVFANPAICKMLGYKEEELLKLSVEDIHPKDSIHQVIQEFEAQARGDKILAYDLPCLRKDGTIFYVNVSTTKACVDTKPCNIGFFTDITEIKHMQDELKNVNIQLQNMNKTLEQKVIERTDEIKHLLKQKDDFINQLSHDLRTPLGPFISLLPILEKRVDENENKKIIQLLLHNANSMKNLVNKTIQLAKLNAPSTKLHKEELNLFNEIKNVLDLNKFIFDEKNVGIINNTSDDLIVEADKIFIEALLTNLFSNAVKYINQNGTIHINSSNNHDEIIISIKDNGIGLSEEQITCIFDEFYKADPSRHDCHSSGLGMTICKRIIKRHGGKIWIESEGLKKGSTVYFSIPK